jgi:hypothetical protein
MLPILVFDWLTLCSCVQKGTTRSAPGLGLRNRTERLAEYGVRRAALLGLGSVAADISVGVRFGLGARKRRRLHLPSSEEDDIQDAETTATHTVVFGLGPEGNVHAGCVSSTTTSAYHKVTDFGLLASNMIQKC